MNLGITLLGLLNALGVKLGVLFFAARLTWLLCRRAFGVEPDAARFRVLAGGLIFFALSEVACSTEEYFLRAPSTLFAALHSIAHGISMPLVVVGIFEILDWKYFHFLDRTAPCLATGVCGFCTQRNGNGCRYRNTLLLATVFCFFIAVPALLAPATRVDANPADYVLPFPTLNRAFDTLTHRPPDAALPATAPFFIPTTSLWIEFRLFPLVAMVIAALSCVGFCRNRERFGVLALLGAAGILFFVYSDILVYDLRRDAYLGGLLHECEELIMLMLLASFLKRSAITSGTRANSPVDFHKS